MSRRPQAAAMPGECAFAAALCAAIKSTLAFEVIDVSRQCTQAPARQGLNEARARSQRVYSSHHSIIFGGGRIFTSSARPPRIRSAQSTSTCPAPPVAQQPECSVSTSARDELVGFDVIIIGAGAAGLYAALSLPSKTKVAIITKESLDTSSSEWAQGGIAAVTHQDPLDSEELHESDTLRAGDGLCDIDAVQFLVRHGGSAIEHLLSIGTKFDTEESGIALSLEAAHSRPRILHAGDSTGREMVRSLKEHALRHPNIRFFDDTVALDLWLHDQTGECQGICLARAGMIHWVPAKVVVIASGGGGQVFSPTSNPESITGDSVALGWRAGARLRDLEFVQFHPTTFHLPGAPTTLVTEAVRGAGAFIIDNTGRRFLLDYHPDGELAPRSIVSQSIFDHMQKTGMPCVYLDLSPIPRATLEKKFPNLVSFCRSWGIDVATQPVPVAPAAHYWMGGIETDLDGSSSVPRLIAIGEAASTGVHGANRLASNSLLECLVFGAQLAHLDLSASTQAHVADDLSSKQTVDSQLPSVVFDTWSSQKAFIEYLRRELPLVMGRSAGISRCGEILEAALSQVNEWRAQFMGLPLSSALANLKHQSQSISLRIPSSDLRLWAEVRNLLDVSYLILSSALFRTESRGAHHRTDYPQKDPDWERHTLVCGTSIWSSELINVQNVQQIAVSRRSRTATSN